MSHTVIHYTFTDEAPMLATYALLPIFQTFLQDNAKIELVDISLASRILCQFGLDKDNLSYLGNVARSPDGHIVKLPNISASIPQLIKAVQELQSQGYKLPDYPQTANPNAEEKEIIGRYSKALGSAVNPVLREGNSDRRVAAPVKEFAQRNQLPVRPQPWTSPSKTHVASMSSGDFYGSEQSIICATDSSIRIELHSSSGVHVFRKSIAVQKDDIIDASFMSAAALRAFYEEQFQDARKKDMLVSLHLKATMMKVSDPIIFGHAVSTFFASAFQKHQKSLDSIPGGINPNEGLAAVLAKVKNHLPQRDADTILKDFESVISGTERPRVAMVDSRRGITNFHVPSDVIIDASMPPMIRDGGKMWNKHDQLEDVKCIIPDRSYSGVYQAVVEDCQKFGQYDHSTLGHVSNVGLMAKKAEEYGSHDKTFLIPHCGIMKVVDNRTNNVIFSHAVQNGDVWRMCQTKDVAIRNWVKLAYQRAMQSNTTAIFWLDPNRQHDKNLEKKVTLYQEEFLHSRPASNSNKVQPEVLLLAPNEACKQTCQRMRKGLDTISVTGNVLRDYLTDLFPIIELGTSAKMLSLVPLLNGGGMYETGAGGSAPKHVQQFVAEGHLRWDSLGEYLAFAECLQNIGESHASKGNSHGQTLLHLSQGLSDAIRVWLKNNKSPSRKAKQIDNRLSSFYIAMYWAHSMCQLVPLSSVFKRLAVQLSEAEPFVVKDLIDCQGSPTDIGGYYRPDSTKTAAAMRPSRRLNEILSGNKSKL